MSELTVAGIGEFALIERLRDALPERARGDERVLLAIGDDAAVARVTPGEHLVVSTDTLNDGVHFRLDWTSWNDLGHKALAVNQSDLAAMGATPLLAIVNLGLTGQERVRDLEALYRGMAELAASTGTVIAGGDITRSPAGLSITVTVIGESVGQLVMRRDDGHAGDQLWVTGTIGVAAAGLRLLQLEPSDERLGATTADALIQALHRPEPRLAAGQALLRAGIRCAMDLSDGLAGDLHKILAASSVDAELDLASLPIPAAVRALFRDEALELAVRGGDDYELLFAAPPRLANAIAEALRAAGTTGTRIGRLTQSTEASPVLTGIQADGTRTQITSESYDHFWSKA